MRANANVAVHTTARRQILRRLKHQLVGQVLVLVLHHDELLLLLHDEVLLLGLLDLLLLELHSIDSIHSAC